MKRKKFGFTLIEVALFLAVTGALFVGILVGTQNSIWQQRHNDALQGFANFLRNVYAEVSNTQSLGDGRSDLAIYGRLITFGQTVGLDGEAIAEESQRFFVYDVIGDASDTGTGSVTEVLTALNANVVIKESNNVGSIVGVKPVGIVDSYSPLWGSSIETTGKGVKNNLYRGSILVVRHPRSGTVMTLASDTVIEVNKAIRDANKNNNYTEIDSLLTNVLDTFEVKQINLCVNPAGVGVTSNLRQDVRIAKNAHNASGVAVIASDSSDNVCN